jgi:hypothetical protein
MSSTASINPIINPNPATSNCFRVGFVKRCCVKESVCLYKRILQYNGHAVAKQGKSWEQILPLD